MQDFIFFRTEKTYFRLTFSEILYVQAENKYVTIVTQAKSYRALSTMNHIEKMLPTELFCRIHRCYIVSLGQICQFDNELVCVGSKKIPLGERYKNILKNSVVIVNGDNESDHVDNDISKTI